MKLRLLLLVLIGGIALPTQAQEVDVTKLIADTKTFVFDNNKNTVKGYIYAELEEQTTCCGSDRIYLEVSIDPSGYVLKVNALTGKNECFKQAAADIVKNVKWDAEGFRGPKSIYFEIKPEVDCGEGRNNNYAQLEIFNNPKLDPEGQRAYAENTPSVLPQPEATKPEVVETKPAPATKPETAPAKEPIASAEKPAPVTPTPAPTRSQPEPIRPTPTPAKSTQSQEGTLVLPPGYPQPGAPTSTDKEIEAAKKRAEAERIAQVQEIENLKNQMAELRDSEVKKREQAAARAKAQEEQRLRREAEMARRQEIQDRRASQANNTGDGGRGGDVGGLFLEPDPVGGSAASPEGSTEDRSMGNPDASAEDRVRGEITNLEQQLRDMEMAQQKREDDARRVQEENERASQEMYRIYEQIALKEEEAAQEREQQELRRLQEDKQRVEDERRQQEEDYQKMMDELRRLQDEADRRIAELENQKRDIERLEELQKAREQEIVLEQTLRETERMRMLKEKEMFLLGRSTQPESRNMASAGSTEGSEDLMAALDFSNEADSEQLVLLVQTINQLRQEIQLLQFKIQKLENGGNPGPELVNGPMATATKPTGTPSPTLVSSTTGGPKGTNGKFNTADKNKEWEKLSITEIIDPNLKSTEYVPERPKPAPKPVRSIPTQAQDNQGTPVSQGDGTPATAEKDPNDHSGTFWDGPGPQFEARAYVEGESKMKELLKEKLRAGGVCGLGQAAFSLTLDPKGNVIRYSVLAANSTTVEFQLSTILPTLKFNAVNNRYNQTIYQEFKAEIICDGAADKVKLQEVESIIKD